MEQQAPIDIQDLLENHLRFGTTVSINLTYGDHGLENDNIWDMMEGIIKTIIYQYNLRWSLGENITAVQKQRLIDIQKFPAGKFFRIKAITVSEIVALISSIYMECATYPDSLKYEG